MESFFELLFTMTTGTLLILSLLSLLFLDNIVLKYFKKTYNGSYKIHSAAIFFISALCLAIFYDKIHFITYKENCEFIYNHYEKCNVQDYFLENYSPYLYFLVPSFLTFIFIEVIIRVLIFRNSLIFAFMSALSLTFIPLAAVFFFENVVANARLGF